MILPLGESLEKRLNSFSNDLGRAKDFVDLRSEFLKQENVSLLRFANGHPVMCEDLANCSIVYAVSSVDRMVKGLVLDLVMGYLMGQVNPPERIREELPIVSARLLMDSAQDDSTEFGFDQRSSMAAQSIFDHFERSNYQSANSVFGAFQSLGYGKRKRLIPDEGIREPFRLTLDELSEKRHIIVHRFGYVESYLTSARLSAGSASPVLMQDDVDALECGMKAIVSTLKDFAQ